MPQLPTIGIIGAGAAGISLAKFLSDQSIAQPTIFEAADRVGGKSYSVDVEGSTLEMGTTYASLAHRITDRWMRELKMKRRRIGKALMDGQELPAFAKKGGGAPLPIQALRYLHHQRRLLKASKSATCSDEDLAELSQPASEWFQAKKLFMMERLCWRAFTSLGYGRLNDIAILHVLRWCDASLLATAVLNHLFMPIDGWTTFWARVAEPLDVRLGAAVTAVKRHDSGVELTVNSETHEFDYLVVTIPIDEFNVLTRPTPAEHHVAASVNWNRYIMTLCAVKDWFDDHYIEVFSDGLIDSAPDGKIMSARVEDESEEFGGKLYIAGQLGGPHYSGKELEELVEFGIREKGGDYVLTIQQVDWKYGPHYTAEAIRGGLLNIMDQMQGDNRTYYSGATFSHEVISAIVKFNKDLADRISADVGEGTTA